MINVLLRPISSLNNNMTAAAPQHTCVLSRPRGRRKRRRRRGLPGAKYWDGAARALTTGVNTAVSPCPKSLRQHRNIRHGHQSPERGRISRHQRHRRCTVFPARILQIFHGGKYLIAAGEHNPFSLTEGATCVGYSKGQ